MGSRGQEDLANMRERQLIKEDEAASLASQLAKLEEELFKVSTVLPS